MEQIKLTTNEAILYITLLNVGLGIIFGLIPLILGFVKKERSYAVFGFLGSIIGGLVLGIFLSIPVAAIFTWLILRRVRNQQPTEVVVVNKNPIDVKVENPQDH